MKDTDSRMKCRMNNADRGWCVAHGSRWRDGKSYCDASLALHGDPNKETEATFDAAEAVIAIRKYIREQREAGASGLWRRGHLILSDIAEMVKLDAE